MKKLISALILMSLILLLKTNQVQSVPNTSVSAECAILIEAQSGRVLYDKNIHVQRPIASISKIMTAIIAIEYGKLDEYVTISKKASMQIGSSLYLPEGEEVLLKDLIYGLLLRSGNDAAMAISEFVAGDVESFVVLMNEKAKLLGLHNTTFENPSGLDESSRNISTAYDMAIISKYAMDNPLYRAINNTSVHRAKTKADSYYVWGNKHKLIKGYDFIIGGKTGYTKLAKRTLVTVAKKKDMELIVVTLNGPDDWNDHLKLFDYGFAEYEMKLLFNKGIFEVKKLNQIFYVDDNITYPMRDDELNEFKIVIDFKELDEVSHLLLVKNEKIVFKKEIKKYDVSNSVLNDSFTIVDLWDGMMDIVRDILR